MKVAFITQDFPPDIGGIQTYSLEIAKRMGVMCDDFVLIAPNKSNASIVDKELNFDVRRIKTSNTLIGIKSIPKVLRLLKKRKIRIIVHAQWQSLLVSVIAKKMGLLDFIGVAVHGREYFFNPFGETTFGGKLYERYKKYLISKADYFFPVSHYSSDVLYEKLGIPLEKRSVVINGTNPDLFYPKDGNALKKEYGYECKMVISSITRLIERKAVDTVLRSIPYIINDIPNLQYVVVGDGPFKTKLLELVEELDIQSYVHFVGKVPYEQVSDYYNLSDIYVMPSKLMLPEVEAFGIVYLEANACGIPAIGSRTGGIADAILDEETGLLVEERNPKELADAVVRLLKDDGLRKKMGKAGRKRVEEEANWDAVTKKIYGILDKGC